MKKYDTKIHKIDNELLDMKRYVNTISKENKLEKKNKSNKKIIIVVSILVFVVLLSTMFFHKDDIINEFIDAEIKKVELKNYDEENNKITVSVNIDNNLKFQQLSCYFIDEEGNKKYALVENNKCNIELDVKDYSMALMSNDRLVTELILLSEKLENTLEFTINDDKTYLAIGGTYKIPYIIKSLGEPSKITWESSNSAIATVAEDGIITGVSEGTATIIGKDKYNNEIKIEVVVTGLITTPHINNSKPFLPCQAYTMEQAHFLDEILFDKVATAGKTTRAGVVAAARFLAMEFPYRIGYFLENGRLNSENGRYADGEGRFYHEGLYLSTDKFSIIEKVSAGPAIWGCKMREYNSEDEDLNKIFYRPNGLDCSGFVTWCLKNGGYDFGDLGSIGWSGNEPSSITWVGDLQYITMDLLKSGKVKAGDLASVAGHVAIVVGIDDNNVYIAEELYYSQGLTVLSFTYQELVNTDLFTHLVLMDDAYKADGNYKNMW